MTSRTYSSEIWYGTKHCHHHPCCSACIMTQWRCNQEWLNELFVLSSKKPFMPRWRQLKVVIIVIVILKVTFIVIAIVISVSICHLPFLCGGWPVIHQNFNIKYVLSIMSWKKGVHCTHCMQCGTLWDEKSCWPPVHLWLCVGWTAWLALKSRYVHWISL